MDNLHNYYTLDSYLKQLYHSKVFKVSLSGHFSCPNRDGTIGTGGCLFCTEQGAGEFAGSVHDSLATQFSKGKALLHQKWPNAKYIAYFQANTNTYAPLSTLKSLFEEAITLDPNIVALSIATRPDCLSDEVITYLATLNQQTPVWIELGLQTIHYATREAMHIGYPLSLFDEMVGKLRAHNLQVIVHIINGLPNETKAMMCETVQHLNHLNIQGIKIHALYLTTTSMLGQQYLQAPFSLLSLEDYVDVVSSQLTYLDPRIVVHRLTGDPPRKDTIGLMWVMNKKVVLNEIDKKMRLLNYHQGCKK